MALGNGHRRTLGFITLLVVSGVIVCLSLVIYNRMNLDPTALSLESNGSILTIIPSFFYGTNHHL